MLPGLPSRETPDVTATPMEVPTTTHPQNAAVESNPTLPDGGKPGQGIKVRTDLGLVQVVIPEGAKPGCEVNSTV